MRLYLLIAVLAISALAVASDDNANKGEEQQDHSRTIEDVESAAAAAAGGWFEAGKAILSEMADPIRQRRGAGKKAPRKRDHDHSEASAGGKAGHNPKSMRESIRQWMGRDAEIVKKRAIGRAAAGKSKKSGAEWGKGQAGRGGASNMRGKWGAKPKPKPKPAPTDDSEPKPKPTPGPKPKPDPTDDAHSNDSQPKPKPKPGPKPKPAPTDDAHSDDSQPKPKPKPGPKPKPAPTDDAAPNPKPPPARTATQILRNLAR